MPSLTARANSPFGYVMLLLLKRHARRATLAVKPALLTGWPSPRLNHKHGIGVHMAATMPIVMKPPMQRAMALKLLPLCQNASVEMRGMAADRISETFHSMEPKTVSSKNALRTSFVRQRIATPQHNICDCNHAIPHVFNPSGRGSMAKPFTDKFRITVAAAFLEPCRP